MTTLGHRRHSAAQMRRRSAQAHRAWLINLRYPLLVPQAEPRRALGGRATMPQGADAQALQAPLQPKAARNRAIRTVSVGCEAK